MELPIRNKVLNAPEVHCFGVEWDRRASECIRCAITDICAVKYQDALEKHIASLEAKQPVPFLDNSDYAAIDQELLMRGMIAHSGTYKVADLVEYVMIAAKTGDRIAAELWVMEFIKRNPLSTINGIVHYKA